MRIEDANASSVANRRRLIAREEELDLTLRLQRLDDEAATMGVNNALREQVVLREELNAIRRADIEAVDSQIRSQVRLADATVYHAAQANAKVLDFLASQKSVTDSVADAKIGLIQNTFGQIDSFLDRVIPKLHGFGDILKQIIGDLLKLALSKELSKLLGLTSGANPTLAAPTTGSGGFSFGNIIGGVKSLFGLGGISSPLTGGFAGGASPAAAIASGGANNLTAAGALAAGGGFFGFGSTAVAGGTAAATTAATVGGTGAATGAAAGGGSMFGSMVPFLTNPWTIGIAAAALGTYALFKLFGGDKTEKQLREAIKRQYGVDIKDKNVLKQIKALGEQQFGRGNVGKNLLATISLAPVQELIRSYAESTGQDTGKLVTNADYANLDYRENQFIRPAGGPLAQRLMGQQRGQAGGAVEMVSGGSASAASGSGQSTGVAPVLVAAYTGALQNIAEVMGEFKDKLRAMSPGQVLSLGKDENPEAVVDGFNEGLARGHKRDETQTNLGFRN
jgi:hypothetical protein